VDISANSTVLCRFQQWRNNSSKLFFILFIYIHCQHYT